MLQSTGLGRGWRADGLSQHTQTSLSSACRRAGALQGGVPEQAHACARPSSGGGGRARQGGPRRRPLQVVRLAAGWGQEHACTPPVCACSASACKRRLVTLPCLCCARRVEFPLPPVYKVDVGSVHSMGEFLQQLPGAKRRNFRVRQQQWADKAQGRLKVRACVGGAWGQLSCTYPAALTHSAPGTCCRLSTCHWGPAPASLCLSCGRYTLRMASATA